MGFIAVSFGCLSRQGFEIGYLWVAEVNVRVNPKWEGFCAERKTPERSWTDTPENAAQLAEVRPCERPFAPKARRGEKDSSKGSAHPVPT